MATTREIFVFRLSILVIVATSKVTGLGLLQQGFNAACPISYASGCEIGEGEVAKGAYDGSTAALGGTSGYLTGFMAGINCGLFTSGVVAGNTTQRCNISEAECCGNTGVLQCQCGDNSFQEAYSKGYLLGCQSGYKIGTGQYAMGSLDTVTGALGAYLGGVSCEVLGIQQCLVNSGGYAAPGAFR